ncbi:MAG: alpha-amylase [Deltaproteobacteria bacterium]|nr:alpha-amylase [Deltaproteobacteria bacterium]
MPSVCFYFQIHQPLRLRHYTFFDIHSDHEYEHREQNRETLQRVTERCYLPVNRIILNLIKKYRGDFRVAFSITGSILDQFEKYRRDAIESFQRLADTGCVEFINETYYHSLAFLFSPREFKEQVISHRNKVKTLFGQNPKTFRHTELIYNNDLARMVEKMGYAAVLAEGTERVLGWRSPNYVYRPAGCHKLKLLLRNYRLSDDISFRFSDQKWSEYPLTADKYARWVHDAGKTGDVINLFMDYETFGEHLKGDAGVFDFLRSLPGEIMKHPDFRFQTPAEVAGEYEPVARLDVPHFVSWADVERDLSAWLGNALQKDALHTLYGMESKVRRRKKEELLRTWRMLQTSDHFYYMCTKWFADGDVHDYFNPYSSPYDAYINYMNVLDDFSSFLGGKGT